ncbi:NAD-dependent protein deacylase [Pseudothauera nasutitermitis]|uniref:NAD-dependent protein deacylase n=2 Tax=Pseudothauera nasutitermitis TaxID=2565930 RepID=A0A4S4B995_9RHOO|nr:NAD-dependent protein deacylase [Pseudothauera nasutitermitis]
MLHEARKALMQARRIVVFTGAGMSAESGVPTFRDALTGLWARFSAEALATPEAFARDPALVWGWYEWRRARVRAAQPNAGHRAIAAFAAHRAADDGGCVTVVTQNVDDLHERAGTPAAVHLHGSLFAPRCSACAAPGAFAEADPLEPEDGRHLEPPHCAHCGGTIRPGVVWFGEGLPEAAWAAASAALGDCDLVLCVGTSALVYPAAALPERAVRAGALLVQVNPGRTAFDALARFNLRGSAATVLPALLCG